jgi:MoxR-like ATPase
VTNVTVGVPYHFVGRDAELADLIAGMQNRGRVALYGLRGVGKTVMAAAYARMHRVDYVAIWWVRSELPSTLRADLTSLGVRLGWVEGDVH